MSALKWGVMAVFGAFQGSSVARKPFVAGVLNGVCSIFYRAIV